MTRVPRRAGFSLVELLVVIAIIIILMALALIVVTRVWNKVDDSRTVTEISAMGEKFQLFKQTFGAYPPSRLLLCENGAQYNVIVTTGTPAQQQLALQSIEFLTKIFPGISLTAPVGRLSNNNPIQGIGHDWAGRFEQGGNGSWPPVGNGFFPGVVPVGAINVTNYILEGEEILVYMLGGMRYGVLDPTDPNSVSTRSAPRGFSTNKVTPCAMPPVNGPSQRLGPFFEFAEDRIVYSSYNPARGLPAYNAVAGGSLSATGVGYFPVYNDRFGTPFAFFAARGGTQNNYIGTDCLALVGPGFVPYFQSQSAAATVFHKSDTFQIVSAGRDRLFGSGGRFDPTNPEQFLTNSADYDNVSNVSNGTIVPK